MKPRLFPLAALPFFALARVAAAGDAAIAQVQTVNSTETYSILPCGDIEYSSEMKLNVNEYNRIKSQNVNPYRLVRDVRSAGGSVWRDIKVSSDDAAHCYRVGAVISGLMKNTGERWEGEMTKGYDFVNLANNEMAFTCSAESGEGYRFQGKAFIKLPPGATDARWDPEARLVSYRLPYPAPRNPKARLYMAGTFVFGAVSAVSAAAAFLRR